jgi:transposase InsO family protein
VAWFAERGITIERILTDYGSDYRSHASAQCRTELGIAHIGAKPYRPAANSKVERFNRTLLDEWAYTRLWISHTARAQTIDA